MLNTKFRCKLMLIVFMLFFTFLSYRLYYYQIYKSKELMTMAHNQYTKSEIKSELNFELYDRKGYSLLNYTYEYYIVIDNQLFRYNDLMDDQVNALLLILKGITNAKLDFMTQLNSSNNKIYFKVDSESYSKVRKLDKIKGLYSFKKSVLNKKETYDIINILTNPIDNISSDLKSSDCLENKIYEKTKNNSSSYTLFDINPDGIIKETESSAQKGNVGVTLTIDKQIQNTIKEVINNYSGENNIGVLLMESSTGKILALNSRYSNVPNIILGGIGNGFEPASTFKVIVEEAALESKSITIYDKFNCESIFESPKEFHGSLSVENALVKSCNDIFIKIGRKTGFSNVLETAKKQGLFSGTKVLGIKQEKTGDLALSSDDYSSFYIGQTKRITPLQGISIINTIANGGVYVKPMLVDGYSKGTEMEYCHSEERRVISTATAKVIKNNLEEVVRSEDGTGHLANIIGIEIGGKTGTSSRGLSEDGHIKSDGWFTGFFKINKNYYTMLVYVCDINSSTESAGKVAAPIFKSIVNKFYKYLVQ